MIIGKKIEIFLAVAEAQSFTAATKTLSIGQSVISHHIENLEREMGVRLFERRGKTIRLTDEGATLYERGKRLLLEAQRIEEAIVKQSESRFNHIHLGGDALTCAYTLPWNLAAFKREHPSVLFTYQHLDTDTLLEKLAGDELDLALAGHQVRNQKIHARQCYTDEIVLAGPPGLMPDILPIEELPALPIAWVNNDKGLSMTVARELGAAGIPLKRLNLFMELHDLPILKTLLRTGVACAFLPRITVEDELNFGLLKQIRIPELELSRQTYLLRRKTTHLRPIVEEFIGFIEARLHEERTQRDEIMAKKGQNASGT